ncbi:MAG TPA: alginate lyase family protein [Candidatus Krumholzibacteria bacterium]|nr:alginate lyase family protein [Candidatus Krumholzibacteria bacterium]
MELSKRLRRRARGLTGAAVAMAAVIALVAIGGNPRCEQVETDPHSAEWVIANQPERVRALFDSLNLDRPGLEPVRKAVRTGDYLTACEALLNYYRTAPTAAWLRRTSVPESDRTDPRAIALLSDTLSYYKETGRVRRTRRGTIDWAYAGPREDQEWNWSLNSLHHVNILVGAYFKTGRREYVTRIDDDIRDWILSNPMPHWMTRKGPWRGIEVATRGRNWMNAFYALQQVDEFTPATRLLMLASLSEHAQYLLLYHRREAGNWAVTELEGLATIATAWPEFRDAPGWRAYSLEQMGRQMTQQVYPDGTHSELTSLYHRITAEHFDKFIDTFRDFGYPVPDSLSIGVQKMWSYLGLTIRPDGTTPENNDAERRDIREKLLAAANTYNRPDWTYMATNGRSGVAPSAGPSVTFPWGGHAIMRNGWKPDAQWSFFDVGPYGTAHQHRDKLHVSVDAFGRALLVDCARYNYQRGAFRDYFTGSAAHNVIRIDGADQKPGAERARDPLATSEYGSRPGWDYARGIFNAGYEGVDGQAIHTRALIYVRDRFWVVADRIETDRPRTVEALWHFAPDCSLSIDGRSAVTTDAGVGNLRVVPVGGVNWKPEIVAGRGPPDTQGWYSGYYNEKQPTPTAVFRAEIPGTTIFAWVLLPALGAVPGVTASVLSSRPERIELRIQAAPSEAYLVTIPMNAWRPTVRREEG